MKSWEFEERNSRYLQIDERPNDELVTPSLGREAHGKPIAVPFFFFFLGGV